jgi:hypothetical protein
MASSSVLSNGVLSSPIAMYCSYHIITSPLAGSWFLFLRTIVSSLCVLPPHPSSVFAWGEDRNQGEQVKESQVSEWNRMECRIMKTNRQGMGFGSVWLY